MSFTEREIERRQRKGKKRVTMYDHGEASERGTDGILLCCGIGFSVLPEECIALIISFTSPSDASRFALVSKVFQSAADSDAVWESFLPSDYKEIISCSSEGVGGSVTNVLSSLPKKELYLRLADSPLLIDGGTKSFALDKRTGTKCYMMSARSLSIVWGDEPRYWDWTSKQESRFQEVAKLTLVFWFDIKGKIKTSILSPDSTYAAYFVFKMEEVFGGFRSCPFNASVGVTGGEISSRKISLNIQRGLSRRQQSPPNTFVDALISLQQSTMLGRYDECPKQRGDGWFEVEIGEFYIQGDEDGDVEMALREIEILDSKYGLIVEGIEIRPKVVQR